MFLSRFFRGVAGALGFSSEGGAGDGVEKAPQENLVIIKEVAEEKRKKRLKKKK